MLQFGLSPYAKFNSDLRGFAYDTDVPGAVKNVSALHPLSLAIVTDNREIFTKLARPLAEFFVSRERFLFCTDPRDQGTVRLLPTRGTGSTSHRLRRPPRPRGGRTFFRQSAEALSSAETGS
ncbi:MAG: hypothetical protein U1F61_03445 [Opitutaceae bacterium]